MYTLDDIIKRGALLYRSKVALIYRNQSTTYEELESHVASIAGALRSLGIKPRDHVALFAENSDLYIKAYFACFRSGAVAVPINFRLSDKEIKFILAHSESKLALVGPEYVERVLSMRSELHTLQQVVVLGENQGEKFDSDVLLWSEFLSHSTERVADSRTSEDDPAILMYTGGTTGLPKGVVLTHRNVISATLGLIIGHNFSRNDVTCFSLPMFHAAIWPVFCMLLVGGTVVILQRPRPLEIIDAIDSQKCTHLLVVPTILVQILEVMESIPSSLNSLQTITYAGAPTAPEVIRRAIERFGPILTQGYGLTEAAPLVTVLRKEDHVLEGPLSRRLRSVGQPMVPVDVRIIDDNWNTLPPGEIGEICISGPNVTKEYWKNPDLTREKIRNGWLRTGDIGYMDEEGYIYLVDRKDDMIITGGENVYPTEVESVIYQLKGVRECAVVGVKDPKWGEKVVAVVTVSPGVSLSEEEIIAHCKKNLAGYKCPKEVFFWSELPKSAAGKILRREVRKLLEETTRENA